MNNKTNFFKKVITSIYDINVFANYAREGIFSSISYAILLTLILSSIKGVFIEQNINDFQLSSLMLLIISGFGLNFINLLINCLIVAIVASFASVFMKMIVKYMALYSLTIYAATLPLIIQTVLETINQEVRFDTMFIIGTLTYVILILKYIKDDIISKFNSKSNNK